MKPLSKEERAAIVTHRTQGYSFRQEMAEVIDALLEAESFWRDAVRRAWCHAKTEDHCVFCHQSNDHAADCLWLLAQEF